MKNFRPNTWLSLFSQLQRRSNPEEGYVLVVVMGMMLTLSSLFITSAITTKVDTATGKASENSSSGFYAAEAGLNMRAKKIKDIFIGYNRPSGRSPGTADPSDPDNKVLAGTTNPSNCRDTDTGNDGLKDMKCINIEFGEKKTPVSTYLEEQPGNPRAIKIGREEEFPDLDAQEYRYDATAVAYANTGLYDEGTQSKEIRSTANLAMSFKSRVVPLFQFAAFYDKDLEILPSPPMTLSGPVHTNGSLYLSGDGGNNLTIRGQVSTGAKLYRGGKDKRDCKGNVSVTDNPQGLGTPIGMNNCSTLTEITNVTPWKGNVRLGVAKVTVPPTDILDPSPTSQYWEKADLRIVLKLDKNNNDAPVAIEVRNLNNSVDAGRTSKLMNSCPVPSTTLRQAAGSSSAELRVDDSVDRFRINDKLIVGSDFDSNAIYFDMEEPILESPPKPNDTKNLVNDQKTISTHIKPNQYASTEVTPDNITFANPTAAIKNNADTLINPTLKNTNGNPNTTRNMLRLRRKLGTAQANGVSVRKAVVSTSDTFLNTREEKRIRMLDVDVQALMDCVQDQDIMDLVPNGSNQYRKLDDTSEGGLVWYFTVEGSKSTVDVFQDKYGANTETDYKAGIKQEPNDGNHYGVRLYNGNTLKSTFTGAPAIKGLTVVTDQALYVRGHYNCEAKVNTVSPNNPPTCDYKKPAAFLADTINVLSENYRMSDADAELYKDKSTEPDKYSVSDPKVREVKAYGTYRKARHTNINAAFLSGTDSTGYQELSQGGGYNGGLENYPRFHEDWGGGRTLTYRGSFVSLARPRRVDGGWGKGGYGAPNRNWDFDIDFKVAENLPPLSPRFVYLRQERFSRDFEQQASFSMPKFFASIFPWMGGRR
jgi:hypothetical protein